VHIGAANGEIVDIPFPRSVCDALLAEGVAEEHQGVPNSGWITFRVRSDEHLKAQSGTAIDGSVQVFSRTIRIFNQEP
jgi:hypothetical protein